MSDRTVWTERLTWNALVALGAIALISLFIGFTLEYPPSANRAPGFPLPFLAGVLDNLWRSAALFAFEGEVDAGDNWFLVAGRILAPLATIGGVLRLSAGYAASRLHARRIARMRDHTVIIGLGSRGRSILDSARGPVAVLDVADSTASSSVTAEVACIAGDGRDPHALIRVGVPRARTVLILTGDDSVNMEILDRVLALRHNTTTDLRVAVRLGRRALVRQLDREDEFVRRGRGEGAPTDVREARIEVEAIDEDRVAGQQLLREHPLVDLADLRAQRRVHVVVVGWSGFVLEAVEQLARLSPYKQFDPPRVDLLVHDPDAVRAELATLQPALVDGGASRVVELELHGLAGPSGLPTPAQMRAIEPDGLPVVTAVVIALETDDASAAAALSLRDRANVEGRWQCPIFVKSETASAPSGLLDRARPVDHGVRIIPVGLVGHTYRLGNMFGDRQEAARKLHHAYLDGRSQQGLAQARAPSVDWLLLPQAYRVASRRAVDHLPIKLLSAGYRLSGYPLSTAPEQDVAADPTRVDTLARLEHRSWEIERILAGWRAGPVRDDRRQINDAIGIDYDELDETLGRPLREYDRVQIRVAAAMLAAEAGPVTVRPEITIGLLGGPRVSEAQVAAIEATCDREVPALLAANRGAAVTVLTSLNPGAELILAERIRGMLVASDVEHRLVVVQTLPREILMDTCPPDLERRVDTLIGSWGEVALANLLPVACTMADWQDPHARAEATRRARAYVVSRAAVVVAVAVPEGEVDRTGVREATGWASGAAAIPPAYAALLAPEPRSPPRTIIVGSAP